ncbi:FAD:protein FMN transferase [Lentisphaera profundi]|uniref:FAD:protein FMN transferase n=1 Tax=Lentisphaera profundi TaxID=1658616 RepID=UPI003B67CAC4
MDIQDDLICINKAGGQISLNGIAQGLAADVAQQALKARGIEHALIDAGELSSLGKPQNRDVYMIKFSLQNMQGINGLFTAAQSFC